MAAAAAPQESKKRKEAAPDPLECEYCSLHMRAPFSQCPNGHELCSDCKPKFKNSCPMCRAKLDNVRESPYVAHLSKTATSGCVHDGCDATGSYDFIASHERACPFAVICCPLSDPRIDEWIFANGSNNRPGISWASRAPYSHNCGGASVKKMDVFSHVNVSSHASFTFSARWPRTPAGSALTCWKGEDFFRSKNSLYLVLLFAMDEEAAFVSVFNVFNYCVDRNPPTMFDVEVRGSPDGSRCARSAPIASLSHPTKAWRIKRSAEERRRSAFIRFDKEDIQPHVNGESRFEVAVSLIEPPPVTCSQAAVHLK